MTTALTTKQMARSYTTQASHHAAAMQRLQDQYFAALKRAEAQYFDGVKRITDSVAQATAPEPPPVEKGDGKEEQVITP